MGANETVIVLLFAGAVLAGAIGIYRRQGPFESRVWRLAAGSPTWADAVPDGVLPPSPVGSLSTVMVRGRAPGSERTRDPRLHVVLDEAHLLVSYQLPGAIGGQVYSKADVEPIHVDLGAALGTVTMAGGLIEFRDARWQIRFLVTRLRDRGWLSA